MQDTDTDHPGAGGNFKNQKATLRIAFLNESLGEAILVPTTDGVAFFVVFLAGVFSPREPFSFLDVFFLPPPPLSRL